LRDREKCGWQRKGIRNKELGMPAHTPRDWRAIPKLTL